MYVAVPVCSNVCAAIVVMSVALECCTVRCVNVGNVTGNMVFVIASWCVQCCIVTTGVGNVGRW